MRLFSYRPAGHIERFSAISSRRHIERRVSGAYRRRADVSFCRYVASQLDICSRCEQSIYARYARIRYVAYGNECRLRRTFVTSLALPIGQRISSALAPYRVADISSDASAAHIDVEPTCGTAASSPGIRLLCAVESGAEFCHIFLSECFLLGFFFGI